MTLRVALVTPPYHSGVVETAGAWPNVAFVYIAGALRQAGFDPVIYDAMTANHSMEEIAETLREIAPDVVMTTSYTSSFPKAVQLLSLAKDVLPGVVTGIGGVHVNFMYDEALRTSPCDRLRHPGRGRSHTARAHVMSRERWRPG